MASIYASIFNVIEPKFSIKKSLIEEGYFLLNIKSTANDVEINLDGLTHADLQRLKNVIEPPNKCHACGKIFRTPVLPLASNGRPICDGCAKKGRK